MNLSLVSKAVIGRAVGQNVTEFAYVPSKRTDIVDVSRGTLCVLDLTPSI